MVFFVVWEIYICEVTAKKCLSFFKNWKLPKTLFAKYVIISCNMQFTGTNRPKNWARHDINNPLLRPCVVRYIALLYFVPDVIYNPRKNSPLPVKRKCICAGLSNGFLIWNYCSVTNVIHRHVLLKLSKRSAMSKYGNGKQIEVFNWKLLLFLFISCTKYQKSGKTLNMNSIPFAKCTSWNTLNLILNRNVSGRSNALNLFGEFWAVCRWNSKSNRGRLSLGKVCSLTRCLRIWKCS